MKKVKIYTWADKTPDFIEKQYETMKAFVKDKDWEFIVFNNTPITALSRRKAIKSECKRLELKCLDVRFRSIVHPTESNAKICARAITWAFHRFFRWDKSSIHVIIDSDIFFIRDFNFNDYLGDNAIAAIHQRKKHTDPLWLGFNQGSKQIDYLDNTFVVFDCEKLPDHNYFNFGLDAENINTGVGGKLYYWLKRNYCLKIKLVKHTGFVKTYLSNINIFPEQLREKYQDAFSMEFIEASILHYRAGSNWENKPPEFVKAKKDYLGELINFAMSKNAFFPNVDEHHFDLKK